MTFREIAIPAICILLSLLLATCDQEGHAKLKYKNLSLTGYSYHENDTVPNKFDFYVSSYIQIDATGNCVIMRRNGLMKEMKYFSSSLGDSITNLINSLSFFEKDTFLMSDFTGFYDGFSYCLTVRRDESGKDINIRFAPYMLEGPYRYLFESLTKLEKDANAPAAKPSQYDRITSYIDKNLLDTIRYPFPIKVDPRADVKFLPPKPDK